MAPRAARAGPALSAALIAGVCALAPPAYGQATVQLEPFAQATRGYGACPAQAPPLLTEEEARAEAHVRVERGTRCGMDGSCEPGGTYRRDPEINARVRDAIAADARFAGTSVWVTTSRKWVTLQGCVRSGSQRKALAALVAHTPGVERVFDELNVLAGRK